MALYQPDPRFTGAADEQRRADMEQDQWRGAFMGGVDQWQQGRQGYAGALSNAYTQANNPLAATGAADARRRNAFAQARRGTRGGSADLSAKGGIQQDYAARLAQILAGGRQIGLEQETQDQGEGQQWRQQSFQAGPGQQVATQAQMDASRARTGQAGSLGGIQQQGIADQQGYQQFLSMLMGGQMSNAAGVIGTAGRTGTGPAWAQALSRSMAGG